MMRVQGALRVDVARKRATLTLLPLLLAASSGPTAPARAESPCQGCLAITTSGNGPATVDSDICPGSDEHVTVEICPTAGACVTVFPPDPEQPCQGAPCSFEIQMRWKLPAGAQVDSCNTTAGVARCVDPAPSTDGTDQSFLYILNSACNNLHRRLSIDGESTCGSLGASLFAWCTACTD